MYFRNLVSNIFRKSNYQSMLTENAALKLEQKNIALRRLLTYAREHSPWYRNILKNINIDSFTHEHLMDLPTLTKNTFMENWDDIVTDKSLNLKKVIRHLDKMSHSEEVLPLDNKYLVLATGGSSGKKGIFIYDYKRFKQFIYNLDIYRKKKLGPYLNLQINETLKTAHVITTNAVHGMYLLSKLSNQPDENNYYFPVTQPIKNIISGLNKVQPHRVIALPSTMNILCNSAHAGELNINPKIIAVGAEPLYEPIREKIYQTWPKVNLFNNYGATEGISARNCKPNSSYMHLNDALRIFFPVDRCNRPVNVGEYCDKLIFTNLSKFILPLINYELEDRLRFMPEPCSCGNPHPLIEEPQGRSVHDFVYQGNIIVHYLNFSTPLLTDGYVVEFHVMQTVNGVKINLVSNGPVKKHKIIRSIQQNLTNLGLHNAQIEIIDVPNLNYLPSGKLQRFTPLKN